MTARVLVVDDILTNVKLLETRLVAEYFEVLTATNGPEALDICLRGQCDIVLLDVMMPGMDGFEVCRRIKSDPRTMHIPVIMVTALDQQADRVRGLEAGADDFLTKPVNDVALITRVKSLVRLKLLTDELTMRMATGNELGFDDPELIAHRIHGEDGRILLVDDRPSSYERIAKVLRPKYNVDIETDPQESIFQIADNGYDLVIVNLGLRDFDALRLCSQIRSLDRVRLTPILVIVDPEENAKLLRSLELGVNDYLMRPVDGNELLARVRTQIRKKRFASYLRDNVQQTIEMAMTDGLTGLHNRRYLENHLATLANQASSRGKPLSLLLIDIDFFKSINDNFGHSAGDDVLREFAMRIRSNIRGIDLASRYGGEEFVVVMPETDAALAYMVAERIRQRVAGEPFEICDGERSIEVTISIGVASLQRDGDSPEKLLERADQALYAAKRDGRNRVVADAA